MHRKVAAALAAALALGLASCGGGDRTETVGRAQLISRLESACLAGQREAGRRMRAGREPIIYAKAYIAEFKLVEERVGHLETTGPERAYFDTYKASLPKRIDALERVVSASRAERPQVIAKQRVVIAAAGRKGVLAFLRLGARHVCV